MIVSFFVDYNQEKIEPPGGLQVEKRNVYANIAFQVGRPYTEPLLLSYEQTRRWKSFGFLQPTFPTKPRFYLIGSTLSHSKIFSFLFIFIDRNSLPLRLQKHWGSK